jgi:hypothetical protein
MSQAFEYILSNKGIDSEDDYSYIAASGEPCWTNAEKRIVAVITNYSNVPANSEAQLAAAIAQGPVSVAIDATGAAFQNYKSGVYAGPCTTKLDHGVLAIGYSADAYLVKNSWGPTWGDKGFIQMKRNTNGSGICGIAMDASYAVVAEGKAVPVPAPTPGPKPGLPCGCTAACQATCGNFGMWCCDGTGGGCSCMPAASCPQCNPNPPTGHYGRCKDNSACMADHACININGITGQICMPMGCTGYGSKCPDPLAGDHTTAKPYCDACVTSNSNAETPNACILACNATATSSMDGETVYTQAECATGATCQPLSLDKDPCDNGSKWPAGAMPCQKTKTCGLCLF